VRGDVVFGIDRKNRHLRVFPCRLLRSSLAAGETSRQICAIISKLTDATLFYRVTKFSPHHLGVSRPVRNRKETACSGHQENAVRVHSTRRDNYGRTSRIEARPQAHDSGFYRSSYCGSRRVLHLLKRPCSEAVPAESCKGRCCKNLSRSGADMRGSG